MCEVLHLAGVFTPVLLYTQVIIEAKNLEKIINADPIAITFFIGYMAMFASGVFFFAERYKACKRFWTIAQRDSEIFRILQFQGRLC